MGKPDDQPTTGSTTTNTDGGAAISGGNFTAEGQQVFGGTGYDQRGATIITEDLSYTVSGLSPFRGLLAYTYAERDLYAGREPQVQQAVERLTGNPPLPLLFVIGASGSGKSSFAQAGLIPALAAHYEAERRSLNWTVFHPGTQPHAALCRALPSLHLSDDFGEELAARLTDAASLNHWQASGPRGQVNLLVIDQFEELFTQSAADERDWLLGWLSALPPFSQSHTHVVATLRSDYLPALFEQPSLYEVAKAGIDLRKMSEAELRRAIQQPLTLKYPAKQFEPALLRRLAADAAPDPTYLPLLQATLDELWRGGSLRLSAYSGDISQAISQHADEVLTYRNGDQSQPRPAAEQAAMLKLLTDLVQVSPDQEFSDTRQQRSYAALVGDSRQKAAMVQELSSERLLSVVQDGEQAQANIIHESLIKNWGKLQAAIKEQRAELVRRERFEQAVAEWAQHAGSTEYLLTGIRLAEARELAASGDVAMQSTGASELVNRSVAAAEAEQKRQLKLAQDAAAAAQSRSRILRRAIAGVSVLLVVSLLASVFAVANGNEAGRQAAVAVTEKERADNQAATAIDQANRSESLRLAQAADEQFRQNKLATALQLGYEAISLDDNDLSRSAVHHVLNNVPELAASLQHDDAVYSAEFSPDGTRLLTASRDNTAKLWDTSGKLLATMPHNISVTSAEFSPDGTRLLTTSYDNTAKLWDTSGRWLATMPHDGIVTSAEFSPDGAFILSSNDISSYLWGKDGTLLAKVTGSSLTFYPDSSRYLVADGDVVRTYPMHSDDLLKIAACLIPHDFTYAEFQQYGISQSHFDINKRVCPAQVSWQQK